MTTDDLTERIARILNVEGWSFEAIHEYDECDECRRVVDPIAARVAREVAVEVRKAKAEVLREAAARVLTHPPIDRYGRVMTGARAAAKQIDRLATEYETGDSDEHR